MPLETVERRVERAIRERGEPCHAHVDADRIAVRNWLRNLALGLNRHEPLAARRAHGDVFHRTEHIPAEARAQPAELRQEDAGIALVELDLFRIGIAEAVGLTFLLEAREVGALGEEVGIGTLQILERLLQRMNRRICEPRRLCAIAPGREFPAQPGVAQLFLTELVALLLQRQRLVEDEPARSREAAHLPLLYAGRHQFVLEGLEALHVVHHTLDL